MEALRLPFTVQPTDIDETPFTAETPDRTVVRLSKWKAQAAAARSASGGLIIIAADTLVVHDGWIMGKPADAHAAAEMLRRLAGKWHLVLSGFTVLDKAAGREVSRSSRTEVRMRDYSEAEILDYIGRGEPFDKAGAYAIQDEAFHPVAEIAGCYAGVVGLPLCDLFRALGALGTLPERGAVAACWEVTAHVCDLPSRCPSGALCPETSNAI